VKYVITVYRENYAEGNHTLCGHHAKYFAVKAEVLYPTLNLVLSISQWCNWFSWLLSEQFGHIYGRLTDILRVNNYNKLRICAEQN